MEYRSLKKLKNDKNANMKYLKLLKITKKSTGCRLGANPSDIVIYPQNGILF